MCKAEWVTKEEWSCKPISFLAPQRINASRVICQRGAGPAGEPLFNIVFIKEISI